MGLTLTPAVSRPILSVHASRPTAIKTCEVGTHKVLRSQLLKPISREQINRFSSKLLPSVIRL